VDTRLPITVDEPALVRGRRVLAVEDGPTLTHGGMPTGAAALAAQALGATLVDPRPYAQGSLRAVFAEYPSLGPVLPAMGYGAAQMTDLRATIDAVPCEAVLLGTPIDLRRSLRVRHPVTRARYRVEEAGAPVLAELLSAL
jgi:predicted GTPase